MVSVTFEFNPHRLALTPGEAAEALGISTSHLYRLVRRGDVPATRLGRRLAVPSVALMRLLDVPCPSGVAGDPVVEPPVPISPS